MPRPDVIPFTDDYLDAAAQLLAERHRAHLASEPLLAHATDFRAQIEREWHADDAVGAAAVVDGGLVGYLVGRRREDVLGPHGWVDLAGFTASEPEVARDLYALVSEEWVRRGVTRHFVFVPALDELVRPWFRLSFGASAAMAVRETGPEAPVDAGVVVRRSRPADLRDAALYDRLLKQELAAAPSFGGLPIPSEDEVIDDWKDTCDEPQFTHFVAERDGRILGHALLYRRPAGDLRIPDASIDLANAATDPDTRGSGIGLALTAHVLTWAHENGYRAMTTDWRMTNLLASRFWPARGWRETFLRLYRSIP